MINLYEVDFKCKMWGYDAEIDGDRMIVMFYCNDTFIFAMSLR